MKLRSLMNLGPAMQKDLILLRITRMVQFTKTNSDKLYKCLQRITKHGPCVWNAFAVVTHEANAGKRLLSGIGLPSVGFAYAEWISERKLSFKR